MPAVPTSPRAPGGDEFVALVSGGLIEARRIAAQVMQDLVDEDRSQATAGLAMSVSIGVAAGEAAHLEETQKRGDEQLRVHGGLPRLVQPLKGSRDSHHNKVVLGATR